MCTGGAKAANETKEIQEPHANMSGTNERKESEIYGGPNPNQDGHKPRLRWTVKSVETRCKKEQEWQKRYTHQAVKRLRNKMIPRTSVGILPESTPLTVMIWVACESRQRVALGGCDSRIHMNGVEWIIQVVLSELGACIVSLENSSVPSSMGLAARRKGSLSRGDEPNVEAWNVRVDRIRLHN